MHYLFPLEDIYNKINTALQVFSRNTYQCRHAVIQCHRQLDYKATESIIIIKKKTSSRPYSHDWVCGVAVIQQTHASQPPVRNQQSVPLPSQTSVSRNLNMEASV